MSQAYPLVFAKAYSDTLVKADFKHTISDFIVEEELGFEPSGSGEHLFLYIEKQGLTTEWVLGDLAKQLQLARKNIGVSGLKDKQGITRQWISAPWPIKQELPSLSEENYTILQLTRHDRKLKRGVHKTNRFTVVLRNIQGSQEVLEQRLALIAEQGVPNYFGPQRFGFGGHNVIKAEALFAGKLKLKPAQRSIYFSAARSFLFNHYLSQRIESANWAVALDGDVFMLEGTHSIFTEALSDDIAARIAAYDLHPVGVLYGEGRELDHAAQQIWQQVLQAYPALTTGLLQAGLKSAYRALRLMPKSLSWQYNDDQSCCIEFTLESGAYATSVLHELITVNEAVW